MLKFYVNRGNTISKKIFKDILITKKKAFILNPISRISTHYYCRLVILLYSRQVR